MTLPELEKLVIDAFTTSNVSRLHQLDPNALYSGLDKEQVIEEIEIELIKIRKLGLDKLEARPSKCKFCYPEGKAFSFHNTETGEFVIRYVIHQEDQSRFIIEHCQNRIIIDGENGLPF